MFMRDSKKKMSSVLKEKFFGDKKQSEAMPKDPSTDLKSDNSAGYRAAAEELLSAVNSKDHDRISSSIKSFYQMCQSDSDQEVSSDANDSKSIGEYES